MNLSYSVFLGSIIADRILKCVKCICSPPLKEHRLQKVTPKEKNPSQHTLCTAASHSIRFNLQKCYWKKMYRAPGDTLGSFSHQCISIQSLATH